MGLDKEELEFCGLAYRIAETELAAAFSEDKGMTFVKSIYREYQEAGSPKNRKVWPRHRLEALFVCLGERPKWVESTPYWPFHAGRPMTFINQFEIPENDISSARLSPDTVVYVFGTRVANEYGWEMQFRVVEQHRNSPF